MLAFLRHLSETPGRQKQHVKLSEAERTSLVSLLGKGSLQARVFKRATALLALDRGDTLQAVARTLGVDYNTVATWRDKYQQQGLACRTEAPRRGRPLQIDGTQRVQITALACRTAPAGRADWSLRLLADKVVELGYRETLSHTQVGNILQKTKSSRT